MNRIPFAPVVLAALLLGACGGDDDPVVDASTEPDARPPRGTISMRWRLDSGGVATTCADAAAQFVSVQLIRQGEGGGESDIFNCAAGEAATRQVGIGIYDVTLDLIDAQAASLLAEPLVQTGIEVEENVDTSIGEVVFELK